MKKLAVIAGQGHLPVDIATAARNDGLDVLVLELDGYADADFSAFDSQLVKLGSIATTRDAMQARGCDCVVMAGKVTRPSLTGLLPDADALKLLGKAIRKGDDGLLRLISDYFAEAGVESVQPTVFMPDRLVAPGSVSNAGADPTGLHSDIQLAKEVLASLSTFDVGQSIIVQDGRVLAIEAAEGTAAMLARVAQVIDPSAPAAILVKLPKDGQDMRLDMPVIGLETITQAAQAGIGLIAIAAGGVLLADPPEAIRAHCGAQKVSLIGVAGENDSATGNR